MEEKEVNIEKVFGAKRTNRRFDREKLIKEHGTRCAYCGCEITAKELIRVDSYFPFRTHPECDDYENHVLSCQSCNCIKAAKEPIDEKGRVVILHPYKDKYWEEIKIDENGVAYGETEAGKSTIDIMELNRPELVAYRSSNIASFIKKTNDGFDAYDVYRNSIVHIRDLVSVDVKIEEVKKYYYRLLYANVIAAMEAYLSKTIIMYVLNNERLFWNFVAKFKWNNEKIEISQIKQVYDEMDIKVQKALAEVIYHNLPKVKNMYQTILDISILEQETELKYLCEAVDIRHDIVHRNGRKNIKKYAKRNMDEYHNIELEQIEELIAHVDKLVESIEKQIDPKWKNN